VRQIRIAGAAPPPAPLQAPHQGWRPRPPLRVPLRPAHLCPGHRRHAGPDARRRQFLGKGDAGRTPHRRRQGCGDGGRQAGGGARGCSRRDRSGLRPRAVPVPWPGQGPGRRRPRGRVAVL
ncbi:MAG: LSU ribosomal protein L18p (L5e), partial [uncultured Acetobacteraceae bacterium]